ncbi:hypothetical protein D3C75_564800 [compost metagenome]
MHHDPFGFQRFQSLIHRMLTFGASGNYGLHFIQLVGLYPFPAAVDILFTGNQYNLGDELMPLEHLQRMHDNRFVLQQQILLALCGSHSCPSACRHNHGAYTV